MPVRTFLSALALMSCAAGLLPALAQTAAPPPPAGITPGAVVEGIAEYRLGNGLQLLLVPDNSKPSTTVNLTVHVGSRQENYGETGMAHLLEHLMFKGTPTTRNVWAEFTKRGLRANGSTWVDRTNYFASFTANDANLQWYLSWLADALVNSFIAKADLASEMTVVRNEMEMGENRPSRILFQRALAAMYDWHNYGKSTIGARTDVEHVDISHLQAFYRRYYQPDNATLIVAGRFDPAQDGERQVTVHRVGGTPLIYMAYHVPPGSSADFAAVSLLAQVLGDTPGGRLHKRLVEHQLAASTFGFALSTAEPGALFLGAQLAPTQDVDAARAAMAQTLGAVASEPVTAEELERARTQWLNAWEQGFTDPEVIGVQLSEAIALGDWRLYFLGRDQVKRVTLADINRVAAERLKPDNRTVAIYRPVAQPQRAPTPARVDVAALVKGYKGDPSVALAEAFDATPANLDRRTQTSTLASGMKVALIPKGTRGRAVQARLTLRFGDVQSLKGQGTISAAVTSMLRMGGAGLSRQQISDLTDRLRTDLSIDGSGQTVRVSISTVREHLPAAIELLGRLLREPAFPAEGLEEVRRQWLAGIEEQRREPRAVVANTLARHGNPYPQGDPRYAETFDEQEQAVKALTVAQLREFHRRFYSAANAEFAAVGDQDVAAVKKALDAAFGAWSAPAGGATRYERVPMPALNVPPQRFVLATPDKQNAAFGARLTLRLNDSHPDYAPLLLANHMLGGGGNSRLWKRIRETEGLSYDVRSGISWSFFEPNSTWSSSAIFAPQNQAKVEAAWKAELARSLTEGFTQAELDEARSSLLNFRRLARAQDDVVAGQAVNNLYLGRSFALSQQVDERLAAATLEQVNAAWRRHFDPSKASVAWGGDFKAAP